MADDSGSSGASAMQTGLSSAIEPASGLAGSAASIPRATLDPNGRCCGRKPLEYKCPRQHFFCSRCSRQFSPHGDQEPNWAYRWSGVGFMPTYPNQEPYRTMLASAMSARSAETAGLGPQDASAVPQADAQPASETPHDS